MDKYIVLSFRRSLSWVWCKVIQWLYIWSLHYWDIKFTTPFPHNKYLLFHWCYDNVILYTAQYNPNYAIGMKNLIYLGLGIAFGFIIIKSQIASWFRIQEMVFFDSFHMYGVIGMAVLTGMTSLQIIKRLNIKALYNETPKLEYRAYSKYNLIGGILFGFGWSISGACPGPIFALIGTGAEPYFLVLTGALVGGLIYKKIF